MSSTKKPQADFSDSQGSKPQQTNEDQKKENVNSANIKNTQNSQTKPVVPNIFANMGGQGSRKVTNIFAAKKEGAESEKPSKSNIFENGSKSVNLFSVETLGKSNVPVLKSTNNPFIKNQNNSSPKKGLQTDEGEESSNSSIIGSQRKFLSTPQKQEMKFAYRHTNDVIAKFSLFKFKSQNSVCRELVDLFVEKIIEKKVDALEDDERASDLIHFNVRGKHNKVSFFHAVGIKGETQKVQSFMKSEKNLQTTVLKFHEQKSDKVEELTAEKVESDTPKGQWKREIIRMQFENQEEAARFRQVVKDLFGEKLEDEKALQE